MAYAPGSFSKNFAWHGTGFRRLQEAIKAGFGERLAPVDRERFRRQSGVGKDLDLLPVNFFLHNLDGAVSVDELVFQALRRPHSLRFDRLSLYAFHLNRVGSGRDSRSKRPINSHPAMWANEFVKERLWASGAWRRDALSDRELDSFLDERMNAQADVRIKCRNNYRHLFTLCGFSGTPLPFINTEPDEWIAAALFLAWDRHVLDGDAPDKRALLQLVEEDDLHKLLGMERDPARQRADALADLYTTVGGVARFNGFRPSGNPEPDSPKRLTTEQNNSAWLEQEESDVVVERRAIERLTLLRDRRTATSLKELYGNECVFCGTRLQIGRDRTYSEAAHIKPLGAPHDGPDKPGNMLVLCPNHHLQFDRGMLRLDRRGEAYVIVAIAPTDPLHGRELTLRHRLDVDCVRWHHDWFRVDRVQDN